MRDTDDYARMIADSAAAVVPPDGNLARIRGCRFDQPGFSPEVFREMAALGWFRIQVSEDAGGAGLGLVETCALLHALGRGLVPEPVLATILAHSLLGARMPPAAVTGEMVVVAAWQDRIGRLDWAGGVTGGRLEGHKVHVAGAAGADAFAVLTGQGVALIPRDADGVTLSLSPLQDGGFAGDLRFRNVRAEFHPAEDAAALLEGAILAHSAYLLGVVERGTEITLEHLRTRRQFDRPIGSFQALQHRMADIRLGMEVLRAAIGATARRIDGGLGGAQRAAAVSRVKARAAELAMLMARETVQMHGAMGYTDEADAGLFVRKAMTEANRFGSAPLHRRRYIDAREGDAA